jgi:predicted dehydrogenase
LPSTAAMSARARRVARKLLSRRGPAPARWSGVRRPVDPMATPVRIAVIGAGRVAPDHLRVLAAFGDVDIVGLANRGGPGIEEMAGRFGVRRTFSDWRAMVEQTEPDGVLVLVDPLSTHAVVAEVLRLGIPALIEKPPGMSSGQTEELAALAQDRGVTNLVGVNRRWYSVVQAALHRVTAHGPLLGVSVDAPEPIAQIARTPGRPPELLDRWLVANTVHALDLLRYAGGPVGSVHAVRHSSSAADGGSDSFSALVEFEHGAVGQFSSHWRSPGRWRLQLDGTGVQAVLEPFERGSLRFEDGRVEPLPRDPVDAEFKPGFYAQDRAFVEAVGNGETLSDPASDLADAVHSMRLAEAVAGLEVRVS